MSGQMSVEPAHRNFLRAVIGFKGSAAELKLQPLKFVLAVYRQRASEPLWIGQRLKAANKNALMIEFQCFKVVESMQILF